MNGSNGGAGFVPVQGNGQVGGAATANAAQQPQPLHLCYSGSLSCSGCAPCDACALELKKRVMRVALQADPRLADANRPPMPGILDAIAAEIQQSLDQYGRLARPINAQLLAETFFRTFAESWRRWNEEMRRDIFMSPEQRPFRVANTAAIMQAAEAYAELVRQEHARLEREAAAQPPTPTNGVHGGVNGGYAQSGAPIVSPVSPSPHPGIVNVAPIASQPVTPMTTGPVDLDRAMEGTDLGEPAVITVPMTAAEPAVEPVKTRLGASDIAGAIDSNKSS